MYQTRLQAQAAGVPYSHPLSNMTSRMACFGPNMVRKEHNFVVLSVYKTNKCNVSCLVLNPT